MSDKFLDWMLEKPAWVGLTIFLGVPVILILSLVAGVMYIDGQIEGPKKQSCRDNGGEVLSSGKSGWVCVEKGTIIRIEGKG